MDTQQVDDEPEFHKLIHVCRNPQTWWVGLYTFFSWAPVVVFAGLWGVPFLANVYNITDKIASKILNEIAQTAPKEIIGQLKDNILWIDYNVAVPRELEHRKAEKDLLFRQAYGQIVDSFMFLDDIDFYGVSGNPIGFFGNQTCSFVSGG